VIEPFIDEYLHGRTPNPCIECNRKLKFEHLYEKMKELGCDILVTGHYARVRYDEESGRYQLLKAVDPAKDQSYVLYVLTQEQLAHVQFPLGDQDKHTTREIAAESGFKNADKHDSQDICFVPDGDYAGFIRRYSGKECPAGDFVDADGNVLGRHKGIIHYTLGQRRGLGIPAAHRCYVTKIDPESNTVTLGTNDDLMKTTLYAKKVNLIAMDRIESPLRCSAKIRYRHKEQPCTVTQPEDDLLKVVFDEPQRAITPGQSVVLYDGDVVIGGGVISE
jgi:tRNA-specific 2-thiouridylase